MRTVQPPLLHQLTGQLPRLGDVGGKPLVYAFVPLPSVAAYGIIISDPHDPVASETAGYRVSLGTMGRVGDPRVPAVHVARAEGFAEAWATDLAADRDL